MKKPIIVLDGNHPDFTTKSEPAFTLLTPNIDDAHAFISQLDRDFEDRHIEVGEIIYGKEVSFFVFYDLEGNKIMVVCEHKNESI